MLGPGRRTDGQLLAAYASGDEESLAEIVRRHAPAVLGACRRVLGEGGEAEDAAQAVFVILARKARRLGGRTDLAAWLYRSAWYAATVALRARRRRTAHEKEAGAMRVAAREADYTKADWKAVRPRLDAELNRLPASYRRALVACYLEGRTQAEAARVLGLSKSAVDGYCRRGLDRLRRRLGRGGAALSAAALGAMLVERTAAELPAGFLSSTLAAAKGAAAGNVNLIAEGTMKTMTWMKIKVAAAVVCAASVVGGGGVVAVRGLLAAEPKGTPETTAKPKFPINPKVAAMKANTWIKLPTPKVHPITRSSSPWMPYVPEAGVGILWGAGHSGYSNDVWTYDLSRNTWKEMLKAEVSAAADPNVLKLKEGLIMTREERPLARHQWGKMDYDPDRKVIWHIGTGHQGILVGAALRGAKGSPKLNFTSEQIKKQKAELVKAGKNGPTLWRYDLAKNKWSWVHTQDPTGCTRWEGYIRYCPPLKKLIMTPCIVSPNERSGQYKMYDPETNKWEWLKVAWKPLPGVKIDGCWVYGNAPIVYDAKRKVLVHVLSNGGVWHLDPVKKTMTQIVTKEKTLPANLDGPMGVYVFDSASETILGIYVNYGVYKVGKVLKARGFPIDRTNVWALDVEKKKWVLQPKPADGVLPPLNGLGSLHHFYDPVQNATFIFRGSYNGPNGECWVYRYKRAK